jgi:hypothetical protein
MDRRITPVLTISVLLFSAFALAGHAVAQQTQKVSFSTPAKNTKYTEKSETLELGDVPNHVLRVFEIQRTYPSDAPVINGLKVAESWTRGAGDRTDGVGPLTQYILYVMENGDKLFAKMDGIALTASGTLTVTIAGRITSGTGKLAGVRGIVREVAKVDVKSGANENQTEIEYFVGK